MNLLRAEAEASELSLTIEKMEKITGFFNEDDAMHFYLILQMQKELGFRGNIFEIGSYFGRSTSLLAHCLNTGEQLVVCDAFASEIQDHYAETPTESDLTNNILKVTPAFDVAQLEIHSCLSTELILPDHAVFRFAHVDGGHDAETAYADLCFTASRMLKRGIIAIDDYKHPDWPGVTEGTDRFLETNHETFHIFSDMNRHIAKGRKLYLMKNA